MQAVLERGSDDVRRALASHSWCAWCQSAWGCGRLFPKVATEVLADPYALLRWDVVSLLVQSGVHCPSPSAWEGPLLCFDQQK